MGQTPEAQIISELTAASRERVQVDRQRFANLLSRSMEVMQLKPLEIAGPMKAAPFVIEGWASGTVVPHVKARPSVFKVVLSVIEARAGQTSSG